MGTTPENGPRIEIDHGKVVETQTLVERGPKHPDGQGVTVISSFETKKNR
jgi:hypothetical protein